MFAVSQDYVRAIHIFLTAHRRTKRQLHIPVILNYGVTPDLVLSDSFQKNSHCLKERKNVSIRLR